MEFFEKLGKKLSSMSQSAGKKISNMGQAAAKQTKNISDIARLSTANTECAKKIGQLYQAIGEAYYKNHKDDENAEMADQIAQINALVAEIKKARDEIDRIKGIVKCTNCGKELSAEDSFCTACGTKLEKPEVPVEEAAAKENAEEASPAVCPNCNAFVGDRDTCGVCGTKLSGEETTAE